MKYFHIPADLSDFATRDVNLKIPNDPELRRLPNVVLTPHIASATVETRQAMAALTLHNLQAFYESKALPTPVPECQ
jgi:lactate dehydrogenase-like 2-hydroxyacid dehydrogenase